MASQELYERINSLPAELKSRVIDFLDFFIWRNKKLKKKKPISKKRKFGSMKGQIKMSKDFDEPLDDFKDYML